MINDENTPSVGFDNFVVFPTPRHFRVIGGINFLKELHNTAEALRPKMIADWVTNMIEKEGIPEQVPGKINNALIDDYAELRTEGQTQYANVLNVSSMLRSYDTSSTVCLATTIVESAQGWCLAFFAENIDVLKTMRHTFPQEHVQRNMARALAGSYKIVYKTGAYPVLYDDMARRTVDNLTAFVSATGRPVLYYGVTVYQVSGKLVYDMAIHDGRLAANAGNEPLRFKAVSMRQLAFSPNNSNTTLEYVRSQFAVHMRSGGSGTWTANIAWLSMVLQGAFSTTVHINSIEQNGLVVRYNTYAGNLLVPMHISLPGGWNFVVMLFEVSVREVSELRDGDFTVASFAIETGRVYNTRVRYDGTTFREALVDLEATLMAHVRRNAPHERYSYFPIHYLASTGDVVG
jgi:hypothetical protein